MTLQADIRACTLCAERFAKTATAHDPRPVVWFGDAAPILVAGQAPGARVHASGKPFTDPSGDRLRDWMGVTPDEFYDRDKVAILPMAFCFPGYNAAGSDLAPPRICAKTWRDKVLKSIATPKLTLLIGGYAQAWHMNDTRTVSDRVQDWKRHAPAVFALPHPSWRNTGWLRRNPWFETDLLPVLQKHVRKLLS